MNERILKVFPPIYIKEKRLLYMLSNLATFFWMSLRAKRSNLSLCHCVE